MSQRRRRTNDQSSVHAQGGGRAWSAAILLLSILIVGGLLFARALPSEENRPRVNASPRAAGAGLSPVQSSTPSLVKEYVYAGDRLLATVEPGVDPAERASAVGIFRSGYLWVLDVDGDAQFNDPPDRSFPFGGVAGDLPITGDWNGDGRDKVGIYRPGAGLFILDYDGDGQFTGADRVYDLGLGIVTGDVPVIGDWNGDGTDKVGLFRHGYFWILDSNGNGVFNQGVDITCTFGGITGDVPVVGDWDGDGKDEIGLFRQGYFWILDSNGNGAFDSSDDETFAFGGVAGDVPVVGDWNLNGRDKVGVFRDGYFWVLDANGNRQFDGTGPGQDLAFAFGGIAGDKPVTGKW